LSFAKHHFNQEAEKPVYQVQKPLLSTAEMHLVHSQEQTENA